MSTLRSPLWRLGTLLSVVLGGCATPGPVAEVCDLDPGLDMAECAVVHAMEQPAALPPSRGNAMGDDPGAAQLGFAMFYDARFSSNQNVRCATCHMPERDFQDGRPTAQGIGPVPRNTPALFDAARLKWQFWDGRADSLWSQALFPLESPVEMGLTRLGVAHRIAKTYGVRYEGVFGALPALEDEVRFPPLGGPGDAAWEGMDEADREAVNQVAANVGKAFEAYQRKLVTGRAPFDRFLAGETGELTAPQVRGLVVYVRAGCADCHSGPLLSDETFSDLGLPTLPGVPVDRGRIDGVPVLLANPFNAQGPYWDGTRPEPTPPATEADTGAFRTPTLRNVALSAPYGHDGRFATLQEIVDFHLRGGGRGDPGLIGTVDVRLQPRSLTSGEMDDLMVFLEALNGDYPPPPWNDWPDKARRPRETSDERGSR